MSGYDIDRTLADWFEADALAPAPADGFDRARSISRQQKPRPAWLAGPGSHWGWDPSLADPSTGARALPRPGVRWSTALMVVVMLAALLGGAIIVGSRLSVPPSLPTSSLGRLAYQGDGDIFVADSDGRNALRIADGLPGGRSGCGSAGFWSDGLMWSPDGRHLAYRSPRDQVDCARPHADTVPTVLISDPEGNVVAEFHGVGWRIPWAPDSTRVATWLDLYPSTRIGVYGLDGVQQAVVSLPPGKEPPGDYDPVWSSDGSSLRILLGDPSITNEFGEPRVDVWELPVDGGKPRPLPADDPESHWLSSRSPDGGQVAYVVGDRSAAGTLFVADADGAHARALLPGVTDWWGNNPVWSPTGDKVAIAAGGALGEVKGSQSLDNTLTELRLVDVASGSVTTLVPAGGVAGISVIEFSSDGDQILIAKHTDTEPGEALWIVATDGSGEQELVSGIWTGDWQHAPAARPPVEAP